MNPAKKSDYTVQKLQGKDVYNKVETLREDICKQFSGKFPGENHEIELGFIQPGHGFKGKQKWLCSDNCLREMYEEHKGKKKSFYGAFQKIQKLTHKNVLEYHLHLRPQRFQKVIILHTKIKC